MAGLETSTPTRTEKKEKSFARSRESRGKTLELNNIAKFCQRINIYIYQLILYFIFHHIQLFSIIFLFSFSFLIRNFNTCYNSLNPSTEKVAIVKNEIIIYIRRFDYINLF